MFTTVERHRRMPYLKNLVGQVALQALPDLRENSLYETLSFFSDQTGRSRPAAALVRNADYGDFNPLARRLHLSINIQNLLSS